jgi:hypothetical protein
MILMTGGKCPSHAAAIHDADGQEIQPPRRGRVGIRAFNRATTSADSNPGLLG